MKPFGTTVFWIHFVKKFSCDLYLAYLSLSQLRLIACCISCLVDCIVGANKFSLMSIGFSTKVEVEFSFTRIAGGSFLCLSLFFSLTFWSSVLLKELKKRADRLRLT